jgi:hypothetical protein
MRDRSFTALVALGPAAAFIIPSAPVLKRQPPTGPQWLHEVNGDYQQQDYGRKDATAISPGSDCTRIARFDKARIFGSVKSHELVPPCCLRGTARNLGWFQKITS